MKANSLILNILQNNVLKSWIPKGNKKGVRGHGFYFIFSLILSGSHKIDLFNFKHGGEGEFFILEIMLKILSCLNS